METPPQFLRESDQLIEPEVFQPSQSSRKGELIAWGSAIAIALVLAIVYLRIHTVQCLTGGLFLFFLLAGILITFGIWVDSRTSIQVSHSGIRYHTPYKNVELDWEQVSSLRAASAGTLWKITIMGMGRYFNLRISEGPQSEGDPRRFMVVPEGDRLVRLISGQAKLGPPHQEGEEWIRERHPA